MLIGAKAVENFTLLLVTDQRSGGLQFQRGARRILAGDLHGDVGGANVVELFGHDFLGELGFVALAAEVGQVEVAQFGGHDLGGGFGGGDVGQMAVTAEDTLLEAPGTAGTVLQHLHVVIGFEHKDVGGADTVEHQFGDVAEVGGETEIAGGSANEIADGILGIVRDGKGFDGDIGEFKGVASVEDVPVDPGMPDIRGFEGEIGFLAPFLLEGPDGGVLGGAIAIDGDVKFVGDTEQTADMVGMFVGDKDGGKIFRGTANGGEALADLARREAGIHENTGAIGFDIGAIAGGTAAENGELY